MGNPWSIHYAMSSGNLGKFPADRREKPLNRRPRTPPCQASMYQRVNYSSYITPHNPGKHQTIEQSLRCVLFDEIQFQIRAGYAVAGVRRDNLGGPVPIDYRR